MSNLYIGQIIQGGWNFAPRGTSLCNGQLLSIAQNTALFALLGTTFGGNGQTTFALPDLRSRSMVHWGTGPGLSPVQLGEQSGVEQITLVPNQMPQHTHTASFTSTSTLGASTTKATLQAPANGAVLARTKDGATPGPSLPLIYLPSGTATDVNLGGLNVAGTVTNSVAGGSQPVNIRNPYLGITHVIALFGIFPSRS
ncbi:MAG: tail fiber protein [Sphingomonadales bacterium]|jgi:microcystin-dependent protein|uniref:phage tail protein n=2 Tax=Sphingorhabdus sp. TaxID=1902408 RepID=UPI003BAE584E|nr:tail fiber protein [Sphingomonadales bacterium]MBK9433227.1 tail fiber protein [Sphingomonadales bacterium]MBL0022240.1 tail fiber protein [Sphingomonadales bacterium]